MEAYQCMKCGRVFFEPCRQYDDIGYVKDVCPYCERQEWERVSICEMCGNPGHYLEKYCETCKNFIRNMITGTIDILTNEFKFDRHEVDNILQEILEEG